MKKCLNSNSRPVVEQTAQVGVGISFLEALKIISQISICLLYMLEIQSYVRECGKDNPLGSSPPFLCTEKHSLTSQLTKYKHICS